MSSQTPQPTTTTTTTGVHPPTPYKSVEAAASGPTLVSANPGDHYPPISQVLNTTNPGAVQWPTTRPTLTGGLASGRMSGMLVDLFYFVSTSEPIRSIGTPAQIGRTPEDVTMLNLDDNRTRKRNTPGDQSMRRTVQDLVSSIDPNVKIDPEVEDVRGLPAPVLA